MFEAFKTRVKVNKIEHLTDARYFAAAGVDYMGFQLDAPGMNNEEEIRKIAAIKEWVSGPEIFVSSEKATEEILENAFAKGIEIIEVAQKSALFGLDGFEWFLQTNHFDDQLPKYHQQIMPYQNWLEGGKPKCWIKDFPFDVASALAEDNILGLQIDGSAQEKVGVKSFELYDKLFESIV
jgi:hypothetical protein